MPISDIEMSYLVPHESVVQNITVITVGYPIMKKNEVWPPKKQSGTETRSDYFNRNERFFCFLVFFVGGGGFFF